MIQKTLKRIAEKFINAALGISQIKKLKKSFKLLKKKSIKKIYKIYLKI